jgi:polyisoprenoid-binding protein YceI
MTRWTIDPDHSVVAFSIRHMMIAMIRGQFNKISGVIRYEPADMTRSSVELAIDVASVFTGIQKRDDHLRSPDFFDVGNHPLMTFKSTHIGTGAGDHVHVTGELTIRGITRQITAAAEFSGPVRDPFGDGTSMGFAASFLIDREEFGMTWNQPMENNGFILNKQVLISIDLEVDRTP